MSLLLPEPPLQVLPQLAARIGLNEAIVLQQIYWLCREGSNFGCMVNEKRWFWNTPDGWKRQFPFFSSSTIRRTLENLRSMGLILAEQLDGLHRPFYYRVSDSAPVILKEDKIDPLTEGGLVKIDKQHAQIEQETESTYKESLYREKIHP